MTTNTAIIERLTEIYFGGAVQEYGQLLDSIIACKKLDEFLALEIAFDSSKLADIFDKASKEVEVSTNVRPARYDAIFNQVKAVHTGIDFI